MGGAGSSQTVEIAKRIELVGLLLRLGLLFLAFVAQFPVADNFSDDLFGLADRFVFQFRHIGTRFSLSAFPKEMNLSANAEFQFGCSNETSRGSV
jgi:hypothetical protein